MLIYFISIVTNPSINISKANPVDTNPCDENIQRLGLIYSY